MRVFHVQGDQFTELPTLPDAAPATGYLWVGIARGEFELTNVTVQAALQRWTGGQLVDLHVSDLLNNQLPSHFDYTSWYDLLVFRRLAATGDTAALAGATTTPIDTSPVGFAVFDRVLLTVHPADCQVREFFATRLQQQQAAGSEARAGTRVPPSPADLALRMVNYMVDSYLELRRLLTRQLDQLQKDLFDPGAGYGGWQSLLDSRNNLHLLEDTCEDQRAAITEWIDAQDELPPATDAATLRERELLRVRSRDVQEHIERVLTHVRRLESMAENAVQMHFSAQSHRTNEIMRTLTVLTAIFLPLNLVTGYFGMNFEGLPLIHSARGFWIISGVLLVVGIGLSWFFWRKRYLGRSSR
jgi:Mg2+ and Co2+ transporter CorA